MSSRKQYDVPNGPMKCERYFNLASGERCCRVNLDELDCAQDVDKTLYYFHRKSIDAAVSYGKYGWALYDNHIPQKFLNPAICARDCGDVTQRVDEEISKVFKAVDLFKIKKEIIKLLRKDNDSIDKFKSTIKLFREQKYHDAVLIMFSLIDSQSINFLMSQNVQATKQGFKAFVKTIQIKFGAVLQMQNAENVNFEVLKNELFEKAINFPLQEDDDLNDAVYELVNLIYTFHSVFDNYKWEDANEFPASINRNISIHGIYKNCDIKRYDFIKLLFLLRRLLRVYSIEV